LILKLLEGLTYDRDTQNESELPLETAPSTDTPIACTLETGEFKERLGWIAELNREALLDARREGLRLTLTYRPDEAERVREMIRREQQCCAFLGFDLREEQESLTLVIEAPQSAADGLDAIFEPFVAATPRCGGCGCSTTSGQEGEDNGDGRSWLRAIGIGILVSILTAAVMLALTSAGVSPFPTPPSLAFAETVLRRTLPLPFGLLFHTVYVTFWSVVYVRYFSRRDIWTALSLAAILWIVILVVFFPLIGWGLAGLSVSPKLIAASLVPHLLFGLLLWASDTYLPRPARKKSDGA
jgi:hypothetical protein